MTHAGVKSNQAGTNGKFGLKAECVWCVCLWCVCDREREREFLARGKFTRKNFQINLSWWKKGLKHWKKWVFIVLLAVVVVVVVIVIVVMVVVVVFMAVVAKTACRY